MNVVVKLESDDGDVPMQQPTDEGGTDFDRWKDQLGHLLNKTIVDNDDEERCLLDDFAKLNRVYLLKVRHFCIFVVFVVVVAFLVAVAFIHVNFKERRANMAGVSVFHRARASEPSSPTTTRRRSIATVNSGHPQADRAIASNERLVSGQDAHPAHRNASLVAALTTRLDSESSPIRTRH